MLVCFRSLWDAVSVASVDAATVFSATGSLPAALAVMLLPSLLYRLRRGLRVAALTVFVQNAV